MRSRVALVHALDELVPHEVLRRRLGHPQDDVEVDAGVAEAVVADERLEFLHAALDLGERLPGDLHRDALDVGEVAPVRDPDLDQDRHLGPRPVEVRDDGRRQPGVGDQDHVVADVPERGVPPVDVDHVAFLAAVEPHVVAGDDLLGGQDVQAGEQVRERVLQREGHGQAADSQGGEQRGDRHPHRLQHDQPAEDEDQQAADVREDRARPQHVLVAGRVELREAPHQPGRRAGPGEDDGPPAAPWRPRRSGGPRRGAPRPPRRPPR